MLQRGHIQCVVSGAGVEDDSEPEVDVAGVEVDVVSLGGLYGHVRES